MAAELARTPYEVPAEAFEGLIQPGDLLGEVAKKRGGLGEWLEQEIERMGQRITELRATPALAAASTEASGVVVSSPVANVVVAPSTDAGAAAGSSIGVSTAANLPTLKAGVPVLPPPPPPRKTNSGNGGSAGTVVSSSPRAVLPAASLSPVVQRRLARFYERYNPSKLPGVLSTLADNRGREEELFSALCRRYGPEPDPVDLPLPEGWIEAESTRGDLFYINTETGQKSWRRPG